MSRIVFVSPLPPPAGGIATWTREVSAYIGGRYDVEVVNTALTGERSGGVGRRISIAEEFRRARGIWGALRQALALPGPRLVHINTPCTPTSILRDTFTTRICRRRGAPYLLHCRCDVPLMLGTNPLIRRLFAGMVRGAAGIMVLNESSLAFVRGFSPRDIRQVPNLVPEALVSNGGPVRETLRDAVFVGQIKAEKGAAELLSAARALPDIRFHLIGTVGEHFSLDGAPENVVLHGRLGHDEVLKRVDEADVFLLPSWREGFSMALLEAMARGTPCVSSDAGAARDMLADGVGAVTPARDAEALRAAIDSLRPAPVRQRMRDASIERVRTQYTLARVVDLLSTIWDEWMEAGA